MSVFVAMLQIFVVVKITVIFDLQNCECDDLLGICFIYICYPEGRICALVETKKFTAGIISAALLFAGISTPTLAQASNLHSNQPKYVSNAPKQVNQTDVAAKNVAGMVNDLIPAPTQHFGKPDGKLPEVRTSISYVDGDSTDNHADTNKTHKILRPGSKLTLRATAKFIVPEAGDVFRPYLRLAIPKIPPVTEKPSEDKTSVDHNPRHNDNTTSYDHMKNELAKTGVSAIVLVVAAVVMFALGLMNKLKLHLRRGKHRE